MTTAVEDLVAAAGESHPVPPDGFARIVAELQRETAPVGATGDPASRPRATPSPWAARLTGRGGAGAAVAAALLVAFALAVVSGGGGRHAEVARSAPQVGVGASGAPALGAPSGGVSGRGSALPHGPAVPPTRAAAPGVQDGALVVRTATLQVEVPRGQVPTALARVEAVAAQLHGYVATSSAALGDHDATATATIRVPVAAEPAALAQVEQVGRVRREAQSGQDVSAAHADLVARLRALTASRDRYLAILAKARDTGAVLAIQQSVDAVQAQIEQLRAQQADLEQRSAFAALDVTLTEPPGRDGATARGPWARAWHDAWTGFTSGVQAMLAASGRVLLLVLVALGLWALARTARLAWRRRQLARLG